MRSIVVAGGDSRDVWLSQMLQEKGYHVRVWGVRAEGIPQFSPSDPAPDVLIGPMTGIGENGLMTTMMGQVILSHDLLKKIGSGGLVAAGLISDTVLHRSKTIGIRTVQYRLESSFMWLNAIPTAEGAFQAAIGRSGKTLFGSTVGIVGFGRVGMVLANRLARYGASVVIFERLAEKRAMARAFGYLAQSLEAQPRPQVEGVFNTAPAPVLDASWFREKEPRWVIDLASLTGGLVPELVGSSIIRDRYQQILSIPGRVAPIRAAEIVWETLGMALEEEEEHDGSVVGSAYRSGNGRFAL